MKALLYLVIASTLCLADHFTDLLVPLEFSSKAACIKERQKIYKHLLPTINKSNPDLFFIRSREPKSMSLENTYLAMIESAFFAEHFIETGTYKGDTTSKAALHFPTTHTIELNSLLYKKAQERFKGNSHIHLYHGDSVDCLPLIIKKVTGKTIFFLDAHYSLGDTSQGNENTPILTELECIQKAGMADAIIIIDDIRMFYTSLSSTRNTFIDNYPTIQDIVEKLLTINSTYQCACIYDTLIAYPAGEQITVSPVVYAVTMSRLFDGTNFDIEELIKSELIIAKSTGQEAKVLEDLALTWIEPWSKPHGLSRHHALWYGLNLLYHESYAQALSYFKEARIRGIRDWRIDWYCAMAQAECHFDYAAT